MKTSTTLIIKKLPAINTALITLIAVIGVLICSTANVLAQTIFNETFPTNAAPWTGTGQNLPWTVVSATDIQVASATVAVGTTQGDPILTFKLATNGFLTPESAEIAYTNLDLSAYSSTGVKIRYYWQTDDVDAGEGLRCAYSTNSTNGVDGTWILLQENLDPVDDVWTLAGPFSIPGASCVANFKLRFSAKLNATATENVWVDDIRIFTGNDYCLSYATTTTYSYISNVTFNTINNSSTGCANYTDFTNIITTVSPGSSYNLTITKINDCTGSTPYTGRFAAWIDWNNDGDFADAGEQVLSDGAASDGPVTALVTVPAGATIGTTRMRCIFREGATAPPVCGSYTTWGETEDYSVNICGAATPTAPTTTGASRCGAGSVTLSASGAGAGENYKWYDALTIGTLLQTNGATYVTPSISVTTTYYVSIYNTATPCAESVRTAVVATINAAPAITVQPANQSVCPTQVAIFTVTATGAGLTYQWQLSTNGGGTWSNIADGGVYSGAITATLTITGVTAGMDTYQYRVIVSGTCAPSVTSSAATLTVTAGTVPTTANAGPDQTVTADATTLAGNTPDVGTGAWSVVSGTATITTPSSPTSGVTGLAAAPSIATLRWTTTNGSCTSTDDMVIIRYCAAGTNTAITSYENNVTFNTINRSSPGAWESPGYINTGASTNVAIGETYNLSLGYHNETTSQKFMSAWIDFNKNGSFTDPGENVLLIEITNAAAPITSSVNTNVVIPTGAFIGNTRMRTCLLIGTLAQTTPCNTVQLNEYEDYDIIINPAPVNMTYVSSTTTQNNTTSVNAGTYKQEVVGIQIVTSGTLNPLSVTSFSFNTIGTTNATNDISAAQLWTTGTSSSFATTTQVGSAVSNPNGVFSFTPSVVLSDGTNYFWLTYDVKATAPGGDVIDATCNSLTVGVAQTPTVTAPEGNRPIIAATNMVYVSSTTTQNSSRATRPDINAHIIGVQIVTNEALSPLSATSFSFNTTGTTATVTDNIQNAKLWFTGLSSSFIATTQVGSTVAAPSGAFTITPSVAQGTLYNGTNYFWLTYDIKATAACDPAQADAQCTSITLTGDAGSPRTPSPTAPAGARVIDCLIPYYSKGSLPANLLSSWSLTRDGTGASPATFDVGYKFYVQNGHSMTTSAAVTIPYLTIEAGGYITDSHLITMTDLRITSFGTFEQVFKATSGTYITNFYIENDGTWIHNNEGYLPSVNRYFSPNSNQWFYQWGGGTFPSGTSWGNVLLNGTTLGNFGMGNVFTTIQGNFEWRKIGNNNYLQDEVDETINIGGNLIFSGGWWKITVGYNASGICNVTRIVTVNVTGDLIITAGTLEDHRCGASDSKAILNVGGNVNISGGTINLNIAGDGLSELNLTGGTPSVTWSQTGGTVTLGKTNIKTGKTVTMTGTKMGNVAASRTITVETGATLNCSNYPVSGAGLFTLASGATLGIGSAAGIVSSGASGNVQVGGTRSFNSGATYRYYEGLTPQSTGNFTTTPTAITVANLIIDKTNITDIVNLTNTTRVTNILTLTKGILTTSSTAATDPWIKINTGASVSPAGGSANSFVNGFIRKEGTTAFVFPTGNGTKWRRIGIDAPSVSTEFEARYINAAYSNTTSMASTPTPVLDHVSTLEHWILNRTDAFATTLVTLYWEDAAASGILKFDSLVVARFPPSEWVNTSPGLDLLGYTTSVPERTYTGSATGNGAGTIRSNTVSNFSPFTFGSIGLKINNPLPVELLSFTAECLNENKVLLEWTTATETNNDYFTIERSCQEAAAGGSMQWEIIGTINGAGNSVFPEDYLYIDNISTQNILYYRLSQVDYDGASETFAPVSVNCSNLSPEIDKLTIFPNPATNTLYVEIISSKETEGNITIHTIKGVKAIEIALKLDEGITSFSIDLKGLSAGTYLFRLITPYLSFPTDKFNVQR